jgi:archaemetzincin
MMKIGILRIGHVDSNVIGRIRESLQTVFADARSTSIAESMSIPEKAFNKARGQYRSDIFLAMIHNFAKEADAFDRVLGVVDVDIFVPRLTFVFGEAETRGKAALISLWRLRPEFYGKPSDMELFVERSMKEAVHELGHTLGLGHCSNPFCVMYFSNSIFETDRKKNFFCNKCFSKVEAYNQKTGKNLENRV